MANKEQREIAGAFGLFTMFVIAAAVTLTTLLAGCQTQYGGGKITDGLNVSAGARLPANDTLQITLFNYLSGFNFSFDDNAAAELTYQTNAKVSFMYGLYESSTDKTAKVKLDPCVVAEEATDACNCASGGKCTCEGVCKCEKDCACGNCGAQAP